MGLYYQVASYGTNRLCPWAGPNPQGLCFTVSSNVAEVAIGDATSCARLMSGVVICWGNNVVGQIGSNTMASDVPPPGEQVSGLNATNVVAGNYHACAIPSGNQRSVVCWGDGAFQPIGVSMTIPSNLTVRALGAGAHAETTCAIISDGSLQCWGTGTALTAAPVAATW